MSTDTRTIALNPNSPDEPGTTAAAADAALPEGVARQALQMALRLLELVEARRRPAEMSQALAQVGRCLKSLAAYGAAETYLTQALRWTTMVDAVDSRVELTVELAELAVITADTLIVATDDDSPAPGTPDRSRAGHAARERARDLAYDAVSLATRTADGHWEAKLLLRVSDVLARCGDHDDAAKMQQRALVLLGLTDVPLAAGPLERMRVAGPTTLM